MTDINALTDGIYESKPGGITPPVERGVNLSQYVYLRSARRFVVNYKLPWRELHHFTPSNTRASSTVCHEGIATPD